MNDEAVRKFSEVGAASVCDLTVIVLTFNEEIHIRRCLESVSGVAKCVVVVDSGSTDRTREIAREMGADVFVNPFVNHARQFNWALDNSNISTKWVLRLDADEYLTAELANSIPSVLTAAGEETDAFTANLRRVFMGKWLRHGALYPIRLLRLFRFGRGRCEERWMDEHLAVRGRVGHIEADFVDHNLNSIGWWTDKHNRYASREAVELLLRDAAMSLRKDLGGGGRHAKFKRWLKDNVYARLPLGFRPALYFFYRYVLRLGFLDGWQGFVFHFLQGWWYRMLVDVKIYEVRSLIAKSGVSLQEAIREVLALNLEKEERGAAVLSRGEADL